MLGWILFWALASGATIGLVLLFRSFRKWREPTPTTPEQLQAQMRLHEESHQTDRVVTG